MDGKAAQRSEIIIRMETLHEQVETDQCKIRLLCQNDLFLLFDDQKRVKDTDLQESKTMVTPPRSYSIRI